MTKPFMIAEFRTYLSIDKNALDDEVIRHPSLLYEVSEAYVQAAAIRDELKEHIATIDAGLDATIRNALTGGKFTEAGVKAEIQTDPKHTKAFKTYLEAKKQADLLLALKDAFQQRSYMLRDLVQLHVTGYFQDTSVKTDARTDDYVYQQRRDRLARARDRNS